MLDFLQEFFDAHPEVATNEVFVTGESYAGHYVPAVSHRIWKYNQAPSGMPINFKGLAIGVRPPPPRAPVARVVSAPLRTDQTPELCW